MDRVRQSCEERCVGGERPRAAAGHYLEHDAIGGKLVDGWAGVPRVAVTAQVIGPQSVDGEEDDVRCAYHVMWWVTRNAAARDNQDGKRRSPQQPKNRYCCEMSKKGVPLSHSREYTSVKDGAFSIVYG